MNAVLLRSGSVLLGRNSFPPHDFMTISANLLVSNRKSNGYPTGGEDSDGCSKFAVRIPHVGGSCDKTRIGNYYKEMLRSNPGDSLLLRNYAKFLHEVERDVVKAEEYYGRAILASPEDGDVLCLYGKLIWEMERDEKRAGSYFDRAVHASPDDCTVLGAYAQFMWEAEEDEEDEVD